MNTEELEALINSPENEHLEFKEAKNDFDFEKLCKYCVAIANEGGGMVVLGVTDKIPRRIVGSKAFPDIESAVSTLTERLHIKVSGHRLLHPCGCVLVFRVPSRPKGYPIEYKGQYLMRAGGSLKPMTQDMLRGVFEESGPDFSESICSRASVADLDNTAVDRFRDLWIAKSSNQGLRDLSVEQLLSDAELVVNGQITYAALILLGQRAAITKYLSSAELVFEYRSNDAPGSAHQRIEFREAFLSYYERLWAAIDLRNDTQHFHEGLFVRDIKTFNEVAVREAVLNAVAHRDYRLQGSTFVRQHPRRIEIVSPGGMPCGVTVQNILWSHNPRNRRIAESLSKCGFVERSGQGVDLMFRESVRESKSVPDFTGSDNYRVSVVLHGVVEDPGFIKFLDQVGQETLSAFGTYEFLALDFINREEKIPPEIKDRIPRLIDLGVVERFGKGRGAKYSLSRRFYDYVGKSGTYTRRRGLDRDTNKALLLKHIRDYKKKGTRLSELAQVLPSLTRGQLRRLISDLQAEGMIRCEGKTRAGKWYPVDGK